MKSDPRTDAVSPARRPGVVPGRDVHELLHTVAADAGSSLGFWSADLWAFSRDADTLTCRAYWCRDAEAAGVRDCVGASVGLDQSHDLRRLVLAAEVVERHLGDDLSPADTAALTQAGFSSRVDVPLLAGSEVLGVLSLAATGTPRRLIEEERDRLGVVTRLAAAALHAVLLQEAEIERGERLVAMLAAARGLTASLSPPQIAAAACEEAAHLMPGAVCDAVLVLRRDDGTYFDAVGEGDAPVTLQTDAVARQAVELGRPERARGAGGRARLLLPLAADDRPLGYLEVTAPADRTFRAREVELGVLLTGQTAAALERARSYRSLESRAATDTVTGLYGRWYFYERLYAEIARARRYRQPLSLVLAELDGEELLAQRRGPAFRDAALSAVARLVQTSLRDKVDVACRLGGGRFGLLLPSTPSSPAAAGLVADRMRERVASTRLSDDEQGELGRFTMSFGVAGYPADAEDADELANVAEERLARARDAGGDRVEPPLPEPDEEEAEVAGDEELDGTLDVQLEQDGDEPLDGRKA